MYIYKDGKVIKLNEQKDPKNLSSIKKIIADKRLMKKVILAISEEIEDDFNELDNIKIVRSIGLGKQKIYELFSTNNKNITIGYTQETDENEEGFVIIEKGGKEYYFNMKGELEAVV